MNSRELRSVAAVLALLPMVLSAQTGRERIQVALKHWAAPLYWQPSQHEAETIAATTAPTAPLTTPLVFVAMTPCRVVDTRAGSGYSNGLGPPSLAGVASRTFPIRSSTTCSIPPAFAYSFEITVVPPGPLAYLTAYPTGTTSPVAAIAVQSPQGFLASNTGVIPAGIGGSIDVYASNPTDVVIDVNGYYISLNGGAVTTNTALGYLALAATGSGTSNTAVGSSALRYDTSGGGNTANGFAALGSNSTGNNNTAMGVASLTSNTSGGENTATGAVALVANSTGNANTADGAYGLSSNTTGNDNTATGYGALQMNLNGSSNTADGALALQQNTNGTNNTATGWHALLSNTNGLQNLASGYTAMQNNTSGYNNTAVGAGALSYNNTGFNNIAVGFSAASVVSSGNSNNIHIGSVGAFGDSATTRIGTTSAQKSFFAAGIRGATTGNNDAIIVVIDSNGQLGTINSSRRFKEDIQDMGSASSGLLRLRPVTFRYTKPYSDGSKPIQYGLIAEEVEQVYPDLVAHSADGQIESVKYQLLDSMLLNEVQRQHSEIVSQKDEIGALQQQVKDQAERMAKLESALAALAGPELLQ